MKVIFKGGKGLVSGKVVKNGGEMRTVGANGTTVLEFSVLADSYKKENGEWEKIFVTCQRWGEDAKNTPELERGDDVICTGHFKKRSYTNKEGKEVEVEDFVCDCIVCCAHKIDHAASGPLSSRQATPSVDEADDLDDDLPF